MPHEWSLESNSGPGARERGQRLTWTPQEPTTPSPGIWESSDPCWPFGGTAPISPGSPQEVKIDKNLEPGLRVTVQLNQKQLPGIWKLPSLAILRAQSHLLLPRCPSPHLHSLHASSPESKTYRGKVVSSQDPRTKAGLYWGYTVRLASCLSKDRASSSEWLTSVWEATENFA